MTKRFLRKNLLLSLKIVWGFVFKGVTTNLSLCRELFFSKSNVDDATLVRYMSRFREDSKVVVDFKALSHALPSVTCMKEDGTACWLSDNNDKDSTLPWRIVIGGEEDRIVDSEGVQETARYLGTKALLLSEVPHDLMLGDTACWRKAADLIAKQIELNSNL
eukprot:CAMPEP_0170098170 /NCGR_PEP_ID=MMETSP0020_2-20130122/279_1 /TAXON_ID=98059 /ORGANISM="Dinobryon sp., Strain UTEXLB2267" /LENGTH=161 /DNA_ID=CAMNT_0010320575 /DNA_START=377 /DNA_END=862 /DNA_ORIENTATION=+